MIDVSLLPTYLCARHWLKASISLTVVMGITWIIGILVIEIEELYALAFIFTIFVAFQGLFIFVLFVLPLSKQSYAKWWKPKVAASDFHRKYFERNSLTSTEVNICSIMLANVSLSLDHSAWCSLHIFRQIHCTRNWYSNH